MLLSSLSSHPNWWILQCSSSADLSAVDVTGQCNAYISNKFICCTVAPDYASLHILDNGLLPAVDGQVLLWWLGTWFGSLRYVALHRVITVFPTFWKFLKAHLTADHIKLYATTMLLMYVFCATGLLDSLQRFVLVSIYC